MSSLGDIGSSLRHKLIWHVGNFLSRQPKLLNFFGATLTVEDAFGTPGDTLLTSNVCREIKKNFPRLKINCVTPNPSLLTHDPDIDTLNQSKGTFVIHFWYLDLSRVKARDINVLRPTLESLGITDYHYHARVYLTPEEIAAAKERLSGFARPIVTINAISREMVKVWPVENWRVLVQDLNRFASVVQIGDSKEPALENVTRLAGSLSMRESMAILSQAQLHIGPDSFLMHAANGVDVPSVIIYGGSRPPGCLGYAENANLYVQIECAPCWLHDSHGDKCPYDIKCMPMITPAMVLDAVKAKLAGAPGRVGQATASP